MWSVHVARDILKLHYCCRTFAKAPSADLSATATLQITLCGAGSEIPFVGQGLRYPVWGRSEIPSVGQCPCNGAGSEIPFVGQGPSCVLMLQHDSATVAAILRAAIGSAAFAMPDYHDNQRHLPVWSMGSCSTRYPKGQNEHSSQGPEIGTQLPQATARQCAGQPRSQVTEGMILRTRPWVLLLKLSPAADKGPYQCMCRGAVL